MKNTIKQFLDARGITPYRFRIDTGIAPRTAYDLYNKPEQLPSSTVLSKICGAYRVQPGELMLWEPDEEPAIATPVDNPTTRKRKKGGKE